MHTLSAPPPAVRPAVTLGGSDAHSETPEPAACPDCRGTRVSPADGLPCEWCNGAGEWTLRPEAPATRDARLRLEDRLREEPMYGEAVMYLLRIRITRQRASLGREA